MIEMENSNYLDETKNYVAAVEKYLMDTYGYIKDTWKALIKMLAKEYDLYILPQEAVKSNGILLQTPKGMISNPAIKVSHDSLVQVQKLVQELGISPKIEIKLKTNTMDKGAEEDYLDSLTK